MRLFVAIDIPDEVKTSLGEVLGRLRRAAEIDKAKLSWTTLEKFHITTKFIGEWPENRLEEMKSVLKGVGSPGRIEIAVRGLGWFPNARGPRVLWAGVHASPELKALARATEDAVKAIGVPVEDRSYSPHLTLARIRERGALDGLHSAADALGASDFGSFVAPAFNLYLSRGGVYSKLAEFVIV